MRELSERERLLAELMADGTPWWLAVEAVASTALDRDDRAQTHWVDEPGDAP